MKRKQKKIPKNSSRKPGSFMNGFSFIESMFSVTILSFGIIAIIPLFTSGMRDAFDSRDQVIAAMLAQEGVEIVQNIRDNNWAKGAGGFDDNFPNNDREKCSASYTSSSIENGFDCNGNPEHYRLNLLTGSYYSHLSGTETKFQRKIMLDFSNFSPDGTLEVTSIVTWGGGNFPAVGGCNTASKCTYSTLTLTE